MTTPPIVLTIDGIISSGKSTLHKMLGPRLRQDGWDVINVEEPVQEWEDTGLLQTFYSDPTRYGYLFQTMAFFTRVRKCKEMYEQSNIKQNTIFLLERSIFSDPIFVEVLRDESQFSDIEYNSYQDWWGMWSSVNPLIPTHLIFLDTDLDVAMTRIRKRNRSGEGGVSRDYQARLKVHHENRFNSPIKITDNSSEITPLKLNGSVEFATDKQHWDNMYSKIIEYIKSK